MSETAEVAFASRHLRPARVISVREDGCQTWLDGHAAPARFAEFFPTPHVERVSPGHLVALAPVPDGEPLVVWRWYDAVLLGEDPDGCVRLWEPAHGEVVAQTRTVLESITPGTRVYASAGLPGADWWVAGPVTAEPEDASLELDEVEALLAEHGLWSA